MPPEEIQRRLKHQPFKPFRMVLADGTAYEIRHPELVLLGRRALILGFPDNKDSTIYDRAVDIDLLHISRLEGAETTAGPNGPMRQ